MAAHDVVERPGLELRDRPRGPVAVSKARPVKWWAGLGAFFVALQVYVFASWIFSGDAVRTPTGIDAVPGWMEVAVRTQEVTSIVGLVICIWYFVIRPWRREGRIGFDAMFIGAVALTYWQDPMYNYSQVWTTYNAAAVNLGSWGGHIPGWGSPNGALLADPLLWSGPAYIWAMFVGVVLANKFVAKVKQRWPQMGVAGVIGVNYLFFLVLCFVVESIWLRTGVYTYAGAAPGWSLFSGHYYQLPIYEIFLYAGYWGGWALVRYFRNDKGETITERGLDGIRTTPKRKSGLRFLALVGVLNVVLLSGIVVAQYFGTHAGEWPKDVQNRSYLTNGLCGPRTEFKCPGPKVPINRPDSAHIAPDGRLIEPR